jgi:hypothetical protein
MMLSICVCMCARVCTGPVTEDRESDVSESETSAGDISNINSQLSWTDPVLTTMSATGV